MTKKMIYLLALIIIYSQSSYSQDYFLRVKTNNIELGKVKEGAIVNVFFKIVNPTRKKIRLYSVSSTCGCTIPHYPNYINSGQEVRIKAQFNSSGFLGRIKKELVLVTDDSYKYYKLVFTAQVIK
jgi:hypothetical protein